MRQSRKILLIQWITGLFFGALLTLASSSVYAQGKGKDVRILVDISSSVRDTVPTDAYQDGLKLLLHMLPADADAQHPVSRAGVWSFGKYVSYNITSGALSEPWQADALAKLDAVKLVASQRNVQGVLKRASFDLGKPKKHAPVIILIANGGVTTFDTPEENQAARQKLLTELLPKLRDEGYTIHTLSIGPGADQGLMQTLAKETGGFALRARSVNEYFASILQLANSFNPSNYLPIHDQELSVDAYAKNLKALIFRQNSPLNLVDPQGDPISERRHGASVKWQSHRYFELVELPAQVGLWRVHAKEHDLSRVYVDGGALISPESVPIQILRGEPASVEFSLNAESFEKTNLVVYGGDPSALPQVLTTDGQGRYSGELPSYSGAGYFSLRAEVEAINYVRLLDLPLQVYDLLDAQVEVVDKDDAFTYWVTLTPVANDLDLDNTSLVATVEKAEGDYTVQTMALDENNSWRFEVADDGVSETYQVKIDLKGSYLSGRLVTYQPKPLVIKLNTSRRPQPEPIEEVIPVEEQEVAEEAEPVVDPGKANMVMIGGVIFVILSLGLIAWVVLAKRKSTDAADDEVLDKEIAEEDIAAVAEEEPISEESAEPAAAQEESPAEAQEDSADSEDDDAGVEVELDLDALFEDETALAKEWQQMDAESNVPTPESDDEAGEASKDDPEKPDDKNK